MATHFSILAWEIPWTEKPGELQSREVAKSRTQLSDREGMHCSFSTVLAYIPASPNTAVQNPS